MWVPEQPENLRSCDDAPPVPPRPRTTHQVAEFMARDHAAGEDCRQTLAELNAWLDSARARVHP